MAHQLYEGFIKLNPWPGEFNEPVKGPLRKYSDANPSLIGVLEKVASKLETSPPDPDYFEDQLSTREKRSGFPSGYSIILLEVFHGFFMVSGPWDGPIQDKARTAMPAGRLPRVVWMSKYSKRELEKKTNFT